MFSTIHKIVHSVRFAVDERKQPAPSPSGDDAFWAPPRGWRFFFEFEIPKAYVWRNGKGGGPELGCQDERAHFGVRQTKASGAKAKGQQRKIGGDHKGTWARGWGTPSLGGRFLPV